MPAWTFSNGNLGFSSNGTGNIYQIAIANPSAAPRPSASCPITPAGHRLEQRRRRLRRASSPSTWASSRPGPPPSARAARIAWTLTVTNNGPGNSSGFAVSDVVPAGVTKVTSTTPGCAVTGNNVLCSEGALRAWRHLHHHSDRHRTDTTALFHQHCHGYRQRNRPQLGQQHARFQTCTTPGITLVKSASVTSFNAAGTVITYSATW